MLITDAIKQCYRPAYITVAKENVCHFIYSTSHSKHSIW